MADLAGNYVGASRVRPGAEESLKPAEIKALMREAAPTPLEIREDATFRHRGALEGTIETKGNRLRFVPNRFDGMSMQDMQARAEDAGREFGLAWIFDPFELDLEETGELVLVSPSVVQVVYSKSEGKTKKRSG